MTITKEEIEAVLAGCDGVTPGPWFTDTEKNDGSYGFGEDTHEGFDSPVLFSETVDYYGKPDRICDAINASVIEVAEEFGEDSHSAWDEQGRKNFAHIARLSPEFVRELAALALEALSSREAGWRGISGGMPPQREQVDVWGVQSGVPKGYRIPNAWLVEDKWYVDNYDEVPEKIGHHFIVTHWRLLPTPPDQGSK